MLDEAAAFAATDEASNSFRTRLTGLHAKTCILDRQDGAHIFLGSLNATGPALHENLDVMVEVVGTASKFVVDRTLEGLKEFLEEFVFTGGVVERPGEEGSQPERAVEGDLLMGERQGRRGTRGGSVCPRPRRPTVVALVNPRSLIVQRLIDGVVERDCRRFG